MIKNLKFKNQNAKLRYPHLSALPKKRRKVGMILTFCIVIFHFYIYILHFS